MHLKEKLIQILEKLTNITPDCNKNKGFFVIGPWKSCFHTYRSCTSYVFSLISFLIKLHFINTDIQYASMKIIIWSIMKGPYLFLSLEKWHIYCGFPYKIWNFRHSLLQEIDDCYLDDESSGCYFSIPFPTK